jgi:cytochrome oxidase Cu insertion factor (SCO1/SenC/PrrC family)
MIPARPSRSWLVSLAFVCLALTPALASAQGPLPQERPGEPTGAKPGILSKIGIDQRLNHHVPLDLPFVDENGKEVRLGDFFGKRPVLLALVYYECPMLCTQVLNGVTGALKVLNFDVGREFDVVAVSINPKEGPGLAAQKKKAYIERYGRPQTAAGWHFLTGREENIRTLAEAEAQKIGAIARVIKEVDPKLVQALAAIGMEPSQLIAQAFNGLAENAGRIGQLNVSPELLESLTRREGARAGQK